MTGLLIVQLSAVASGDDDAEVTPGEGGFTVGLSQEFPDETQPGATNDSVGDPGVDIGTGMLSAFCDGENWSEGCAPQTVEGVPAQVTEGLVARAFRRLPLPEAKLIIQPPNGRTLVNFETNFYTEQGEFTRTVTLLGRQVELRIWPASFGWRFGDGETRNSTSPGAAYPDLDITHEYQKKGRVSPSVDTTYAAQFRVGGGPWRDVAGTVTIPGSPQALRVVEARPVLVGG
jgi:hypothetical protein